MALVRSMLPPLLTLASFGAAAQATPQQQIDAQVWRPFVQAITQQDTEAFMALHSRDLVRAERTQERILDFAQYREDLLANWPRWKASMEKRQQRYTFELRFTERLANATQAFESGDFRNEFVEADGRKHVMYGQFNVVLRNEDGVWKVLVDADTRKGDEVTEQEFAAATPVG